MNGPFYIHRKYRFDGPVMTVRDNRVHLFNADIAEFHPTPSQETFDSDFNLRELEETTKELLLKLLPDSWYKDQFKVYLKEDFYKDLLKE